MRGVCLAAPGLAGAGAAFADRASLGGEAAPLGVLSLEEALPAGLPASALSVLAGLAGVPDLSAPFDWPVFFDWPDWPDWPD